MKSLSRIVGGMASALLLSCSALCNFGAQAGVVPYSKIGWWSVAYLEVKNLSGCIATGQFPDQTVFQMALIQGGANKSWAIFISNPRWNAWIGRRKQHQLWLVTTRPWQNTFLTSDDNKTLTFTDASVEFMNSIADASSVEVMDENKQLLTRVDMNDSAAALRAIVNCVRDHPPGGGAPSAEAEKAETTISGTGFFVAPNRVVTNNHVVSGCTKDIQVQYPDGGRYTARISGQDPNNDLVLLHTDMDNRSTATFHPTPRVGDPVATYGFPYPGVLSSSGNFTLGNVTSLTGINDDTRFLQMSTPVQPGNSGGALLDMSGGVVGVVTQQLAIPNQNVNFAIQPSIV
jgi:serine protease Do